MGIRFHPFASFFLLLLFGQLYFAYLINIGDQGIDENTLFPNREHKIFNAIGSSLRTEALTANPNGMSVFLAYIDQGSILFHGTFSEGKVKGREWVAFDPNFGSLFARWNISQNKPPIPRQPPLPLPSHHVQQTFNTKQEGKPIKLGNLRTYTTKRSLRLLYLDGLSGLKRTSGTLEFQDFILLFNDSIPYYQDYYRTEKICEMIQDRWENKIDGFIRKDVQFESIICSFEDSLEELDRINLPHANFEKDLLWAPYWNTTILANEARDDSIVRSMVRVNFDSIVSVWNYPINVFPPQISNHSNKTFPSLRNITKEERDMVLKDIDELVLKDDGESISNFIDWQKIVDSIVARYRPVFEKFDVNLDDENNRRWANKSAHESVFVYVDVTNRSREKEMERCTNTMYKLPQNTTTVTSKSVQTVLQVLCSTMLDVYDETGMWKSQKKLRELSRILYWTPWVRYQRERIDPW